MSNLMRAGRELDQYLARHLFGCTVYHYDKDYPTNNYYQLMDGTGITPVVESREGERETEAEAWDDTPAFSTNIALAWHVLEKLNTLGDEVFAELMDSSFLYERNEYTGNCLLIEQTAEEAAEAICLAAYTITCDWKVVHGKDNPDE